MAIDSFEKQPYEAFTVTISFAKNMVAGETLASQVVTSVNAAGEDATATVIDGALTTNDGSQSVLFYVRAGVDGEVYKHTIKCITSVTNLWEKDVLMKVKEI